LHLHELIVEEHSTCSWPNCPRFSQNHKRFFRIVPVTAAIQRDLDLLYSGNAFNGACESKVTDLDAYAGETRIMKMNFIDEDKVEEKEWHSCGGMRTFLHSLVKMPSLLILHISHSGCKEPPSEITLFNTVFYLVACILCNGVHFNGSINIGSAVLFYDGMAERKLKWVKKNERLPIGYEYSHLFYKQKELLEEDDTVEAAEVLPPIEEQEE